MTPLENTYRLEYQPASDEDLEEIAASLNETSGDMSPFESEQLFAWVVSLMLRLEGGV